MVTKRQLLILVKKYWNCGMNNAYWDYIKQQVDKDITRLSKQ